MKKSMPSAELTRGGLSAAVRFKPSYRHRKRGLLSLSFTLKLVGKMATTEAKKVIIFLANNGQDPTEVAIPWNLFKEKGFTVTFSTEHGAVAAADARLLDTKTAFWKALVSKTT